MAVARPAVCLVRMSLTTSCEVEEVHKKGASSVRSMFAREIAASLAARVGDSPHSAARDTRRRSSAKRSFLQVRIRYKTVCLPKSSFRQRL